MRQDHARLEKTWSRNRSGLIHLEDLLRLAGVEEEFRFTQTFVGRVRESLPKLEDWIRRNVKTLHKHFDSLDGLVAVTKYFLANPWPDCYSRQLPVSVDTKFVSRNQLVLKQWLDELLPDSAIDPNETKFARRFGLRDGQKHRGIRFLDLELMREVGESHAELSLPIRTLKELSVTNTTVFIVENRLNLFTLPDFERGLAIEGEGNAVNRLEPIGWLRQNRIVYWGDNDVEGFLILSRLRNIFPHVESVMMDLQTIVSHRKWCVEGNESQTLPPTNLTATELEAFSHCSVGNVRLEQEKILQPFVNATISKQRNREH